MADSSSSSVQTNLPDVVSAQTDHVSVQVTTIQLTKENYSRWSPAITMGIARRGRIAYVNGRKVEPAADSMAWDTWFLEDNQVKTWIVNSVSPEIQPLILRKKTARDMWIILEQMYGQKKRKVRVYQLMKDVYSLRQDVYSQVEAKEQRMMLSSERKREEQSAYISRAPVGTPRSSQKCTHCKKVGNTRDFCWDLHPEKKDRRGRPSSGKKPVSSAISLSDGKGSISVEQIRELRAYLGKIDVGQADTPDEVGTQTRTRTLGMKEPDARALLPRLSLFSLVYLLGVHDQCREEGDEGGAGGGWSGDDDGSGGGGDGGCMGKLRLPPSLSASSPPSHAASPSFDSTPPPFLPHVFFLSLSTKVPSSPRPSPLHHFSHCPA
ncbi:hypothetical protein EJ110_NYTH54905 [Nymphaea thermarum]|nr:hypothetical protein EJ110_NYTH54905 [Nymphaea thermarum]